MQDFVEGFAVEVAGGRMPMVASVGEDVLVVD